MLLFYYAAYFILRITNTFSAQRYARISGGNKDTLVYSLITGIIAMAVFYVTSGFNINLNLRTCAYGLIYAGLIFVSYFVSLSIYRFMGVAESGFISSGVSLVVTVLTGYFYFEEALSLKVTAQLILTFLTILVLFLQNRTGKTEVTTKTITIIGVLLCVVNAVVGSLSNIVTKNFAMDTMVTDENSFFFVTNVFTTAFSLIGILLASKLSFKTAFADIKKISKEGYLMIVINVISSNIIALLIVAILRVGDLIVFSPLSSALGLIATEVVAVFIAKEKPRIIATLLAISSVLVVLLF